MVKLDTFLCPCCNKSKEIYDQENLKISGILEKKQMDKIAEECEDISISDIKYIYYYFMKKDLSIIQTNCDAAAMPRQFCADCIDKTIKDTLSKKDPHYGDGVYLSIHKDLKNASLEVKSAHGENVSNREYRIKFKIISNLELKKFTGTGGVLRTIERKWHTELFFLNGSDRMIAKFIEIEKYLDGKWVVL